MEYTIHHGDCIPHMAEMPRASVDLAVFSPPFPSLYAYTDSESDIGNSEDMKGDAKLHLSFFYKQLAPLIKPGRVVIVHVMQIPRLKRTGEVGLHDFRSLNIRLGERAGLDGSGARRLSADGRQAICGNVLRAHATAPRRRNRGNADRVRVRRLRMVTQAYHRALSQCGEVARMIESEEQADSSR